MLASFPPPSCLPGFAAPRTKNISAVFCVSSSRRQLSYRFHLKGIWNVGTVTPAKQHPFSKLTRSVFPEVPSSPGHVLITAAVNLILTELCDTSGVSRRSARRARELRA